MVKVCPSPCGMMPRYVKGYLFYQLIPIEREIEGDSITLEMRMIEGPQARINR